MNEEHKIDEIFEYNNNYLQVVKIIENEDIDINDLCRDCFFVDRDALLCCYCTPNSRSDAKDIYYKFIPKNEVRKLKLNQIDNL